MIIEPKPFASFARGYWVTFDNGMKLSVNTAILHPNIQSILEEKSTLEALAEPEKYCDSELPKGFLSVALMGPDEEFIPLHTEDQEDDPVFLEIDRRLTQAQVTELIDRLRAESKVVATW